MSGVSVKVSQGPTPVVRALYTNPQIFRVLGAADVLVTSPQNGQVLTWNAAAQVFSLQLDQGTVLATAAFNQANTANILAQAAFNEANLVIGYATGAFAEANSFQSVINTSYATANSGQNLALSAFVEANSFQNVINSSYSTANVSFSAFGVANSGQNLALSAFAEANSFQSIINTIGSTANSALPTSGGILNGSIRLNSGDVIVPAGNVSALSVTATSGAGVSRFAGNVIFAGSNTWFNVITSNTWLVANNITTNTITISGVDVGSGLQNAYNAANAAFLEANSFESVINTAYATANVSFSAFALANSHQSVINSAFATANVSFSAYANANAALALANSHQSVINTSYAVANSAQNLALSAFTEANSFQNVINSSYSTANVSFSAYANANAALALANSHQAIINTIGSIANSSLQTIGGSLSGSLTITTGDLNVSVGNVNAILGIVTTNNLIANTLSLSGIDIGSGLSSASATANGAVIRTGDTMSGSLNVFTSNAVSINVGTGNITFGGTGQFGAKLQLFPQQYGIGTEGGAMTNWVATGGRWIIRDNSYTGPFFYGISNTTVVGAGTYQTAPYGIIYNGSGPLSLGQGANTRGIGSRMVVANGVFSNTGDAQWGITVLRNKSTSNATINLSTTGANTTIVNTAALGSVYTTNQIFLPNNSVYAFTGTVVARDSNNNCKLWSVQGGVKCTRGPSGTTPVANANYIGSPTITVIASDSGTANWGVNLLIDSTNNSMIVQGSGSANSTNWVASIQTTEVA